MLRDLRRAFFSRSMKLLQHPTVSRLLADPRTMELFIAAVRTKDRATDAMGDARTRLLHLLGLASSEEVGDLKTVIGALERKVRRLDRDDLEPG
jgi:hypothetical protein